MSGVGLLVASVLITVVPALIYLWILWVIDRHEKEPKSLLAAAVAGGVIVAPVLTVLVERILGIPNSIYPALFQIYPVAPPSFGGAIVEELAKGVVVFGAYTFFRHEFDNTLDGIVYGAAVGVGFALAESVSYLRDLAEFAGTASFGPGFFVAIFLSGLTHCVFSGLFGATLGYVRETSPSGAGRVGIPIAGLLAAILYHLGYVAAGAAGQAGITGIAGVLLSLGRRAADWAGVVVLALVVVWAWSRERSILRWGLADEVAAGALTGEELAALGAGRPVAAGRMVREALAELAFAKWRLSRGLATEHDVNRERERVLALRAKGGEGG